MSKALGCFDHDNPVGNYPKNSSCHATHSDIVMETHYSSSFLGASLAFTLLSMKVDNLVICSFSTSRCVHAMTTDAAQVSLLNNFGGVEILRQF